MGKRFLPFLLIFSLIFMSSTAEFASDRNAITLIDQPDRKIEVKKDKVPALKRGLSTVTGVKNENSFQPVLVEINNENGGVWATAPRGITEASVIYEYQMSTNGTTGICALFQDSLPAMAGPVGNASIGGVLIQDDWKCGYVYNDIPKEPDGEVSELGYSIETWIERHNLLRSHLAYPANVSRIKEWKKYFKMDQELITEENQYIDTAGIKKLLDKYKASPALSTFAFLADPVNFTGDTYVSEIDIRSSSRTFTSWFVYNESDSLYYRWVGENNQYGDVTADEQLHVSNLIIQRVEYNTSNKNMAPVLIGKGNADIFIHGYYIDGYWVRESVDEHTRYYDADGNLLKLVPGVTYIALVSNSTAVVILN